MAYIKQTWTDYASPPDGEVNATRLNYIEQGIFEAHAALPDKADLVGGAVPLSQLPTNTLAESAPSVVFAIYWDGMASAWQHLGVTITSRPTDRTDLTMHAYGGTVSPSFMIPGDIWFEDVT